MSGSAPASATMTRVPPPETEPIQTSCHAQAPARLQPGFVRYQDATRLQAAKPPTPMECPANWARCTGRRR